MPEQDAPLSNGIFHLLTLDEFQELLERVRLRRSIEAVHLHHSWRPRHADFNGVNTIVGMWRFHTQTNGWSDIAQHLSIDPDGGLWTGRHWDLPPASAAGHNGSMVSGPFMIEMIGDFDAGRDLFKDRQRLAALSVLALLLDRFDLTVSTIRFHNQMSPKTCPGTSIDRTALLREVEALRGSRRAVAPAGESPFSSTDVESSLFKATTFLGAPAVAGNAPRGPRDILIETLAAELAESDAAEIGARGCAAKREIEDAARQGRDVDVTLTSAVKESLKPFVVNLRRGKFSTDGEFTTSKEEVDAIFDIHLPKALAGAGGLPLRVVFYAHGGLVGEKDGLGVALKHVDWWQGNGVYPIYFVWETDFLSSLVTIILSELGLQRAGARDALDIIDAQIEAAARRAHANRFWADMKHIAELSSAPDGGALYVAKRLGAFCKAHGPAVEVHAVGHSAGANFHGFFVPVCLDAGVPRFETLQFLAPAITVDGFFASMSPRLGSIGPVSMFTMKDSFEQDDDCKRVYNKSLLYLIHHALEERRETDLLGLEISVRRDLRLRRLFGLDGTPHPRGHEVVWSVTTGDRRASSESTSHGGFDDDPATMNSVLRRVLKLTGADEVPLEFVRPARNADVDAWTEGATAILDRAVRDTGSPVGAPTSVGWLPPRLEPTRQLRSRRALCIGINNYKRRPLRGCVADAERWAATLQALGFTLEPTLPETQATAQRILSSLRDLIRRSQGGDVIAFQFSGHGTTLPDRSGDEAGGDSPGQDEALCPYDFTEGHFIVDDELADVFEEAANSGVAVTSFIDCCHSGSITRLGEGRGVDEAVLSSDERPRFVEATPREIALHLERRRERRAGRGGPRRRGAQRDVLFAACQSVEVAWESGQQGDFTRLATPILRQAGSMTNGALLGQIEAAFGTNPRQHPQLHPATADGQLLFGGGHTGDAGAVTPDRTATSPTISGMSEVSTLLRALADLIAR